MAWARAAVSSAERSTSSPAWVRSPRSSRFRPSVFQYWGRASTSRSRRAARPCSVTSWAEARSLPQAARLSRRDRPTSRARRVRFMGKPPFAQGMGDRAMIPRPPAKRKEASPSRRNLVY